MNVLGPPKICSNCILNMPYFMLPRHLIHILNMVFYTDFVFHCLSCINLEVVLCLHIFSERVNLVKDLKL